VDNNYLDLGMSKSGFIHTLPSGRLTYSNRDFPLLLFPYVIKEFKTCSTCYASNKQ
jgi:hypothetical protein